MTKDEQIQDLTAKLAVALARITELESLVLRLSTPKTSANSSLPPSTDLARKNQSLREKSGRPVGGQKGHKGYGLSINPIPDVVKDLYSNFCNVCGESLAKSSFILESSRQVIDIPPIIPITTEYRCHSTTCSCGHQQTASYPQGVERTIQYGENIQALAIYQHSFQYLPFARLQDFFQNVCNVSLAKGTIENIIRRTAQKAMPIYQQLRNAVVVSFFVGSDETGFKLGGKKGWFWVWQTAVITYIVAACSRSKSVITDTFPEGLPNSVLCSDRLAAQLSTITQGTQICLAHLLRDLTYLIAAEKTTWATDFKVLLKDAIALKQAQDQYLKDDSKAVQIQKRLDKLLDDKFLEELLLNQAKFKQTITFFRGMCKLKEAIFPFLYDKRIAFDNNASERAIRMVKLKTKVSGQFKSLHQEFAIIRSVIGTAIKNNQSVFHAIKAMVNMPMPT